MWVPPRLGCCGQPLPVLSKMLCDASSVCSAGQMEAACTAALCTRDGSPPLAADTALLEKAEQPHQQQARDLHSRPRTFGQGTGCGHFWVTLYKAAWWTGLIPYGQAFVPEAVGRP